VIISPRRFDGGVAADRAQPDQQALNDRAAQLEEVMP
jgi:hypothetical protein